MKRKIDKKAYDDLSEELQKLYKEKDGTYVLELSDVDIDDLEDRVVKMDAKITEILGEKKTEKEKREAAEEEARIAKQKKDGDIDALEASWKEKHAKDLETKDQEIQQLQAGLVEVTSGAAASTLASKIALQGSAGVLEPHIAKRLTTDIVDGKPKLVVLDAEGKPSAATLEDLETEFNSMEQFAPVLVGSKGNGSGNPQLKPGDKGFSKEAGNMGGTKEDRVAALKKQFPDLDKV